MPRCPPRKHAQGSTSHLREINANIRDAVVGTRAIASHGTLVLQRVVHGDCHCDIPHCGHALHTGLLGFQEHCGRESHGHLVQEHPGEAQLSKLSLEGTPCSPLRTPTRSSCLRAEHEATRRVNHLCNHARVPPGLITLQGGKLTKCRFLNFAPLERSKFTKIGRP